MTTPQQSSKKKGNAPVYVAKSPWYVPGVTDTDGKQLDIDEEDGEDSEDEPTEEA